MSNTNAALDFVLFLQNNFEELIKRYQAKLLASQLPLKQIFDTDLSEEIHLILKSDLPKVLKNLFLETNTEHFENNLNNSLDEIVILRVLSLQKQSFLELLPKYSSNIELGMKISSAFENKYLQLYEQIISNLKIKQKELLEKEKHLSLVFNSTSELMLLIRVEPNNTFRPISVNKAYLEATKFYKIDLKEEEFLNKTIAEGVRELFHFDDNIIDFIIEKYTTASHSKVPISYEETVDAPNGLKYYAETTLTPIHDSEGNCTHLLFVSRDISKHKWAEAELAKQKLELKHSNEELEQFAYIASHDLQEPLRMISSYVQLLAKNYKGKLDSNADDFIHYTVDGAKRMQDLLHGLLDYSRINTKTYQFDLININQVIEHVSSNLSVSIKENDVTLIVGSLPSVNADQSQMVRLFQNLIGNAIKYHSNKKNIIEINAELKNKQWLFSVKDNGIGIEEDYFDRIFNIFQRLHTRNTYPGDGLGLALCKKIIEKHNGKIWVESELDKGSTFFFTLPA